MKKLVFSLILIVLILAVTLAAAEIAARLLTSTDENGNVYLGERRLLPYRFPVNSTRHRVGVYRERRDEAYVVDHPLLGWTVGPDRDSETGLYRSNSRGLRSPPREYSPVPDPGTLRIALFGDSFTHGDEEPWQNSWADKLERYLNRAGIRAEVLNFGVGGYCFSQAYLRWLHQGREFRPRIVVIGFQGENIQRTVNIFRSLYSERTWLVFSKPRHILDAGGGLEVVNSPVIPPTEVADYLKDFPSRPLARYEYWHNPRNYRAPFWTRSRLGQVIYNFFRAGVRDHRTYEDMAENGGIPEEVVAAVVKSWAAEAEEEGALPLVIHLPRRDHLRIIARNEVPAYYDLFAGFREAGIEVVDPGPALAEDRRGLYGRSHYSAKGSRVVARVLAERIEALLGEMGESEAYRRTPPQAGEEAILARVREGGGLDLDVGAVDDRFFLEEGFYDREIFQGRSPARWTSGTARLRLPLAAPPGTETLLEIRLAAWGPPGPGLTVELDGIPLKPVPGEENSPRFLLPPAGEETRLVDLVILAPAWDPAEVGIPDRRRLGVMIDRVRVLPSAPDDEEDSR